MYDIMLVEGHMPVHVSDEELRELVLRGCEVIRKQVGDERSYDETVIANFAMLVARFRLMYGPDNVDPVINDRRTLIDLMEAGVCSSCRKAPAVKVGKMCAACEDRYVNEAAREQLELGNPREEILDFFYSQQNDCDEDNMKPWSEW